MNQKPLAALLALTASGLGAQAQAPAAQPQATAAPAAPPPSSAVEEFINQSKTPAPWLTWGADLRLRNEYFNNAQTLDQDNALNEQDYFRWRGRLWTSITPITNLSANVRFSSEPRTWMKKASYSPFRGRSGSDWTYGIFDNLYVQWKNVADSPATLTVGRQDFLTFGNPWLIFDGTPNDGSWTYFLDAARFNYVLKEQKTTIDAVGILHYARDDEWLPTINNQNRALTDQNEKGAVVNIANKSIAAANLDAYFFYKNDTRITSSAASRFGDDADIFTLGARVSGVLAEHWKYSAEAAYQFGQKQDPAVRLPAPTTGYRDMNALGALASASYLVKDRMNNILSFNYEFLSGDDPTTGDDEMFDLLWGRWPRWSELYNVYSYVSETRVAQTANLHKVGPSWSITPARNLEFNAAYFLLLADEEVPTRASAANAGLFSNDGTFRGHYLQAVLKYKFNKHLAGHLWSEFVFPGDFYRNKEMMTFLRAEVYLTY